MADKSSPADVQANVFLDDGTGPSLPVLNTLEEREAFEQILKKLLERQGVDFSHYRQATVLRRFVRRMALGRKTSFIDYLAQLNDDEKELSKLHHDLLLFFTEFFRDPQVFETLKKDIFPLLAKNYTVKNPIRVWVPGCSTGEEVYSLAISLYEYFDAQNLAVSAQFFGTDLVERHVTAARTAVYSNKIEKHVSRERLERFFDKTSNGYRVIKRIREMCIFATQDITQDPPFPNIDLLSCRNLLIYFDNTFQRAVIPLFHFALKPTGFLLLGTSETLGRFPDLFTPMNKHSNIFSKRTLASKPPYHFPLNSPTFNQKIRNQAEHAERRKNTEPLDLNRQVEQLLLDQYAPPGVLVDSSMQIRLFRGRTSRFLDPSTGEASLKLSRMAGHCLMPDLYVAIEEVKREGKAVYKRNIPFTRESGQGVIDISVFPVINDSENEPFFLILFEEGNARVSSLQGHADVAPLGDSAKDQEIFQLRRELLATKEYLQTIIEEKDDVNQELWTANEEVQSTNEELQSVNEELEAAKEELESSNEELIALNEELYLKNTELTEANAFNECTINGSMDGILTFDNSMRIRVWNPAMERMWGIQKEHCLNRALLDLFPFLVENGQKEIFLSVLEGNAAIVENQPYYHRHNGRHGFFQGRYSPLRDHKDTIIGGLAVIHDCTDHKWAEEKLLESEERLKMVMHQSPASIEIYDLEGTLISVNRAYEELWGEPAGRVINRFNILRYAGNERNHLLPYVDRAYSGETVVVPEFQLDVADRDSTGHTDRRWLSSRIYPLKDSSGKVKNIVISIEDVTARKQAEEDLQIIHKLESVGTLAGGIAHDFNNILMGLYGNLTIARAELDGSHPAMEHLLDAEKSISRATGLTQQLLIFAKGGSPLREGVSLGTLVEEVVRFDLLGSNIKPVFDIAEDLWIAEVDRGQIQQVFSNLTVNAKQAMVDGGQIHVTLENASLGEGDVAELKAGNYVRAIVRDEGVGIEPRHLTQIFDPYFSTKRFGRGLGLATAYTILKKHGGCISVDSTQAAGSTFTLYLPVTPQTCSSSEQSPDVTPPAAPPQGMCRILLMDDEEMICKVTTLFLEKEGYQVESVDDGRKAVARYRQARESGQPFGLVIMDLTIPGGMGGREAVKKILEMDPAARVIVSSGYADDPIMANHSAFGFRGIAAKPYSREKLLSVVRRVLNDR